MVNTKDETQKLKAAGIPGKTSNENSINKNAELRKKTGTLAGTQSSDRFRHSANRQQTKETIHPSSVIASRHQGHNEAGTYPS